MGLFMGDKTGTKPFVPSIGFVVEGVDYEDGGRTLLQEFTNSGEAIEWMQRYVSSENAGGWDRIEVVDVRDPNYGSTVKSWDRE